MKISAGFYDFILQGDIKIYNFTHHKYWQKINSLVMDIFEGNFQALKLLTF